MALAHDGVNNRPEFFDRALRIDDIPNLNVIRAALRELPHELHALRGGLDFRDRSIAIQLELGTRDTGDERPGDGDSRSRLALGRELAQAEVSHRTADIHDRSDAAANVAREGVAEIFVDPGDLVFVGTNAGQVDRVGSRVEIA